MKERVDERMDEKGFFRQVYDIVATIPPGSVMTYGTIAKILGRPRAARLVGYAMNSVPIDLNLPCHRVVNKNGSMAPGNIFGGEERQRQMLKEEGVTFLENGCIEMEKHAIKLFY
jgi:methylated-DNA-protein-cysteine methyltransferase-like protein